VKLELFTNCDFVGAILARPVRRPPSVDAAELPVSAGSEKTRTSASASSGLNATLMFLLFIKFPMDPAVPSERKWDWGIIYYNLEG